MPGIDPERPFRPLNIAVLTASDSRTLDDDRSGNLLVERLTGAGHHLADRALVRDEPELIGFAFDFEQATQIRVPPQFLPTLD